MQDISAELAEVLQSRGLSMTLEEAVKVASFVGRMPTPLELHLFDTMWSEHCSYKSSRKLLKTLPVSAPQVVLGPGEDAGIVEFAEHGGHLWDIVVAHESHNHPSQVLPVEGAATGVGGIVRDVYCMGARVIGVMDLLRFGPPASSSSRAVARGVVQGVWQYGNALGVPNLGGDTVFHEGYESNCLVNVVSVGLVRHDRIIHSFVPGAARGTPYVLVLVGKPTDATGFGGATFASADLDSDLGMGAVQVADPFLKRVVAEANARVLDMLFERGVDFGFKDLGAGGIACVSSEMASHGGMGIELWLDKVPVSVPDLPPEVVACAETQERFGLAVPQDIAYEVVQIYNEEFELPRLYPGAGASIIGRFTSDRTYLVLHGGREVACAPVEAITEGIRHDREACPIESDVSEPSSRPVDPPSDLSRMALSPSGVSRSPLYSFYDSEVQAATHLRPGEADSVVVVPIPGCSAGLAVSGDGNPFYGELDPYLGGAHAVAEAFRNVVATGAVPLCATDCLNYGSPENPEVFWQFSRGVEGIADACRALALAGGEALPIVSGNVSFYNQSRDGAAIPPSPIVAVFGRLDDFTRARDISLKRAGDLIVLVGERRDELGGGLYYRECLGHRGGAVPSFRGGEELAMARLVLDWIGRDIVRASHDISEGGLAFAAMEMAFASGPHNGLGVRLDIACDPVLLYSETPGYLLEVGPDDLPALAGLAAPVRVIGEVVPAFSISGNGWELNLRELCEQWRDRLAAMVWREE
ncbi:MAG TPA: phosphoribosylformylglycinamidine synthase subunit PurL [Candidatus Fermentibacter daniensis]|mgnify:FL=1|nr:MAG: Phosphoribosylformylglycinamidine synthase 2 [candidate division Hyd24-12 bacterium ADurb.Bin004]HOZ18105.1 phosphoribosylformylglycinamidine synthase subunit PurL [Candidatus Fermentibacter daniensis]HPH40443.1 phosphoribosylformylglycinamidine synthase subunit PurL [Candidatus Fermentibacter daniensis]HPN63330.1 phosphoribosylformylglycinamidine synthase subunit PurL [Candidatus Fermentibacter daniensis]